MSTLVERLELLITASAKGAVAGLKETEAATTGLDGKAKGLTGALQKMGVQGNITGGIMTAGIAGGAIVAGAAVGKMALDGVKHFASLTAEARTYQRVLGGSAEDASRVAAQVRSVGMDAGQAQAGFFQLAKRIGEGTDTLKQWGVEIVHAKDGSVDMASTISNVAAEYQSLQDPTQKAAFLFENFGRAGANLAPILARSREELRGFANEADKNHEVFSADQLEQGRKFDIAMRELHASVTGLEITLGQGLVPVLTETARSITDVVQVTGKLTSAFGGVKTLGEGLGKGLNLLPSAIHSVADAFGIGGHHADELGDATKRLTEAQSDLQKKAADSSTSHRDLAEAQRAVAQAQNELDPIQKRITTAFTEAGVGADNLTSGTDRLAAATKRQADEAKNAADALDKQYQSTLTMTNADLGLEGANINLDRAAQDYTETLGQNSADSLDARDATLRLKESVEAESQAVYDVTAAHYGAQAGIDAQKDALIRLRDRFPELNDFIQTMIDRLNAIPPSKDVRINVLVDQVGAAGFFAVGGIDEGNPNFHGASGAIVTRPTRALIGEAGPEAVVPLSGAPGAASLGGGFGPTVNVVVNGWVGNDQDVARKVADALNGMPGPSLAREVVRT